MLNVHHLTTRIINPVLVHLDKISLASVQLLLGTCGVESSMGHYLVQNGGPALGLFQCEPATHADMWTNYIGYSATLSALLKTMVAPMDWDEENNRPDPEALVHNFYYATAIARLHYYRQPEPLPEADDWPALASYWKDHYNTVSGAGSTRKFLSAVESYGLMEIDL